MRVWALESTSGLPSLIKGWAADLMGPFPSGYPRAFVLGQGVSLWAQVGVQMRMAWHEKDGASMYLVFFFF